MESSPSIVELFSPAADTQIRRGDQLWTRLANRLRQEIFTGLRSPGSRLVETRIAQQFGVAQSSVREALHQLEKEGLVVRSARVGSSVTSLTPLDVEQIYGLRAELEGYAVELVGQKGDPSDLDALDTRLATCRETADSPALSYMMADLEFHLELWKRAGNPYLLEMISRIVIPLFAFETRVVVPSLSREDRLKDLDSHCRVVELLRAGEIAQARWSMAQIMDQFRRQTRGITEESAEVTPTS